MSAIAVVLNGEHANADDAAGLSDLLRQWGYAGDFPFAVAVDGKLVPAPQLEQTRLSAGAQVEVIALRQGG